jgi:L-lactate dehydrogenase complex protein LldG
MSGRLAILSRIREIDRTDSRPVTRRYRRAGTLDAEQRTHLFCERVSDYRADIQRVTASELPEAIAASCAAHGAQNVAAPEGLPSAWRSFKLPFAIANTWIPHELDQLDGVVTGCTVAIAETGTIVLTAGPREGARALTLVPDLHICVVEVAQIVELVPEGLAQIAELVRRQRRPVTMISGPSATSDIELSRVEGVHGPRSLVVLVV